jgi:hypothetical protein
MKQAYFVKYFFSQGHPHIGQSDPRTRHRRVQGRRDRDQLFGARASDRHAQLDTPRRCHHVFAESVGHTVGVNRMCLLLWGEDFLFFMSLSY